MGAEGGREGGEHLSSLGNQINKPALAHTIESQRDRAWCPMGGCCGSNAVVATAESGAYAHSPHARSQPKSVKKHSRTASTKEVKPSDSAKPPKEPKSKEPKSPTSPAKATGPAGGHVKDTSNMKPAASKDNSKALAAAATIDEFDLMSVLGTGQFGCVKLARHKLSGAACAMKLCHTGRGHQIDKTGQMYESLAGKLLPKIDHRYVIKTYTTFWGNDQIYTVMDLADGGDLEKHLKCVGKFSSEEAKFYIAQVALGLDAIHKCNIVWHDLKPDNCLLTKNGYVKLIDFGLAGISKQGNRKSCCGGCCSQSPLTASVRGAAPKQSQNINSSPVYRCLV